MDFRSVRLGIFTFSQDIQVFKFHY
jgi:hypothetical protein